MLWRIQQDESDGWQGKVVIGGIFDKGHWNVMLTEVRGTSLEKLGGKVQVLSQEESVFGRAAKSPVRLGTALL